MKSQPKYEKELDIFVKIAKKIIPKENPTIFEIGARDCAETLAFHNHFPQSEIYTFECNPDTLPTCRERTKDIKNIHLIEKAVIDTVGKVSFFKGSKDKGSYNPGGSSIYERDTNEDFFQDKIEVETTSLKKEIEDRSIKSNDMLWMDIQGAELLALKGAKDYLKNFYIIYTETEFLPLYKKQPLFTELRKYLNSHGFKIVTFTSIGKNSADVIFINTNKAKVLIPQWLVMFYFMHFDRFTNRNRGLLLRIRKYLKKIKNA